MTLWLSSAATPDHERDYHDPADKPAPASSAEVEHAADAWLRLGPRSETGPLADGEPMDRHDRWNFAVRGETPTQRLDRSYGEILQELRVVQTAVQLLMAFLLALALTPGFTALTKFQSQVYVASLLLGTAANALLIAPAPFHRLVFQRRLKRQLVRASGRYALFGTTLLMLALSSSLLLIFDIVIGTERARWVASGTLGWFFLWWFVVPLWSRVRHRRDLADAGAKSGLPAHRHRRRPRS
jgi:hypothetical protein